MALARCKDCGRPHGKGGNSYSAQGHSPVGFPNGGIVCGIARCENAAYVWLTTWEEREYENGRRVFQITGGHAATKFRIG